jgi:hypothetical protein
MSYEMKVWLAGAFAGASAAVVIMMLLALLA